MELFCRRPAGEAVRTLSSLRKLKEMRASSFNLRFQMATSQLDNTASSPNTVKDIARIMTEQRRSRDRKVSSPLSPVRKEQEHDRRALSRKCQEVVVTSVSGAKTIVVTITERKPHHPGMAR